MLHRYITIYDKAGHAMCIRMASQTAPSLLNTVGVWSL